MFSASSWITLTEGGAALRVFVAPSLYGVSKARGIDITSPIDKTTDAVVMRYAAIAYCAAVTAWEIDKVDSPDKGEFPHKYADFVQWAYGNETAFLAFVDFATRTITGKGVSDYAGDDGVKKKTRRGMLRKR